MENSTKRTTHHHQFDGEDEAYDLLFLLNDADNYRSVRAAQRRILGLLRKLQQLSTAVPGTMCAIGKRTVVAVASRTGTVDIAFTSRVAMGQNRPANAAKILETLSAKSLIALGWKGLLDRVRQCKHCQYWIFARRTDQVWCSAPRRCRQQLYDASPQGKAKRSKSRRDRDRNLKEQQWK